jgi:2-polyprenyl-3-methyl-5-hydroxy-6-metoxy-1,4-benzoquinol methylase
LPDKGIHNPGNAAGSVGDPAMSTIAAARGPADIYDEAFVPALFAQWGPVVAEAAGVGPGERVLDVACGTGALTLAVADRVGPAGSVVGLDANPETAGGRASQTDRDRVGRGTRGSAAAA